MFARLLALLFPAREDEEIVRSCALDEFLTLLDPELVPLGDGESAAALLPFVDRRVRAAIHEAKYRGSDAAFDLLAATLAEYLRDLQNENVGFTKPYMLVPIPLGNARRKERGFNQAEEVAQRVAKELKMGLEPDLLVRTRETASQVSLPRQQRLRNMRGAFGAASPPSPAHTYILIDDVLTTGATLSAAVSALKSAGAEHVLAVALAH